jgi:hypothetical protein
MDTRRILLAAVLAGAGIAAAQPGEFTSSVDSVRPPMSEDSAVHGFTMLKDGAADAHGVGVVGRAYSVSGGPDNTVWGLVAEAVNFAGARGNVVGMESGVVNMAPDNTGELRGLHVVFKNRMDLSVDHPVPVVGANRFNEQSEAIMISSQPRSTAGEYSGWQAGIKFDRNSLDRSASVPYAAAIDVSEVQVPATFYLIVWRCGKVKCGLQPTEDGAVIVTDIDNAR